MAKTVTIVCDTPLEAHEGKKITQIVMREPTMEQFFQHGDPWTIALSEKGVPFSIENGETISAYAKICIIEPKDHALLNQGGIALAKKIKGVILDFFRSGAPASEGSANMPTNSLSTTESAVGTS
jgi:hypothetical protein